MTTIHWALRKAAPALLGPIEEDSVLLRLPVYGPRLFPGGGSTTGEKGGGTLSGEGGGLTVGGAVIKVWLGGKGGGLTGYVVVVVLNREIIS